ncbi:hypothetical protein [Sodalis-like endosymbiont of Proechinophthirus fluctus]|uniref:hypothetical protein n=1 Tax=Sodalis-like endosymbiont of Proechinophthirus fluctus TaxID=1462730 RepID=UPI000832F739|nr:hypothetical protein [Sodalis-like endosymbiont of Proechinophthirus fluctus]
MVRRLGGNIQTQPQCGIFCESPAVGLTVKIVPFSSKDAAGDNGIRPPTRPLLLLDLLEDGDTTGSRFSFRPFWICPAILLAASLCNSAFSAPAVGENPPVLHELDYIIHHVVPVTIASNTYRFVLDADASCTVINDE